MKKKILFVIPSLDAGGGEKSLINLLHALDYSLFEVDLLAFHSKGIFLQSLPANVNLITLNGDFIDFSKALRFSLIAFLKQGKFNLAWQRIQFFIKNKIEKNTSKAEQISWNSISKAIPQLTKEYDAAIGSLEKSSIYYVIKKVKATTKIGWIHTNYSKSGMQTAFDLPFFEKLNHMVTISEECAADLNFNFPDFKNKIKVIYNIVSPTLIKELSQEKIVDSNFDTTTYNILTIARLSKEKGVDLALEAALQLVKTGRSFKWYIIGDGSERDSLETKIKEHHLENSFILLGLKTNPYPFLKHSLLYVQPSRYEGKSIAIDEAKILAKPIITTNYPTAKDQINNGENGIICEMNSIAIAQQIGAVMDNPNLIEKFTLNLKKENLGTEEEIVKLYNLIHGTT